MMVNLAVLVFAPAALLAIVTLALTWRHYRRIALGNMAALRRVQSGRDFEAQIGDVGPAPETAGSSPDRAARPAVRLLRPAENAGLRAAA